MDNQVNEIREVGKIGFRYRTDFIRPPQDVLDEYVDIMKSTGCLTGNVGDCLGRGAAMNSRIRPISNGMKIVGPALTIKTSPTDNLMIHKGMTLAKPGDVLVIDGGGDISWGLLGFIMVSAAIKYGIAGIIVDGAIRDVEEIRNSGFPIFNVGFSPNGPFKDGPGEVNFPIQCGGQVVNPGDIIVADDDGVVVVPQEHAQKAIGEVRAIIAFETNRFAEIEAGILARPGLDELLAKRGLK